jgi:hypothetical protein
MPTPLTWANFEIQDRLGEGHSGVVLRAMLRRPAGGLPAGSVVAVKRYKPWVSEEPGALERIFREVEVGRRVAHPNVAQVHGAVLDDAGRPVLVMQLCEGPTLEDFLNERRAKDQRFEIPEMFKILGAIARSVGALHREGVIHRDVKPANVIMTSHGPVLTDFGVVRSNDFPEQTTSGSFLGTIRYAAPEYLFGAQYDHSVDVYGFGAIAYELFTGRRAFYKQDHWARLVAEKGTDASLQFRDPNTVAHRYGLNVALLMKLILARSTCVRRGRNLALDSFADCVDGEVWRGSFFEDAGRLSIGLKSFNGRYVTADDAAAAIRSELSVEDREALCEMLKQHFFDDVLSGGGIRGQRIERLVRLQFADHYEGSRGARRAFTIRSVVKEAFALGLLKKPRRSR